MTRTTERQAPEAPMTVREVAELMQVATETVSEWIRRGDLQASNIGMGTQRRRYRVTREQLDEFLRLRAAR